MTAINCFRMPDRGIMMTDAALYTKDGRVVGFAEKAFPVQGIDAVIGVRGPTGLAQWFERAFSGRYVDFDDLSDRIESELRESYYADLDAGMFEDDWHSYELSILGWSKREASAKIYVFTADHAFNGKPDFKALSVSVSPYITDEENENLAAIRCRLGVDFGPSTFDPEFHGVEIMRAQRRDTDMTCSESEDEHHIVGGWITVSEVRPGSVTQRIIHRWNDQIGEHIRAEPFRRPTVPASKGLPTLAPKAGLSRADRRRQAKLSRRKVA